MRTLVHLSDIHFGRVDATIIEPLVALIAELKPDVVTISGDLTQRARSEQFQEARAFLDRLPNPQIVVPGNHDVPLYNVFARFFSRSINTGVSLQTIWSRFTRTKKSPFSVSIRRVL